ncbi:sporulation protein YjcZ [Cohnella abietis]|nr:sporulation protein YjcZ [Cohnella abietis]
MGYPSEVGGAGCGGHVGHGGMSAAAFVLVLFILLVIILKAGTGVC